MNKNRNLAIALLPLLVLPFFYGKKLSLFSSRNLWSKYSKNNSRTPANFVDEEILTFKDYFQVETFNKFISYKTQTNFWSNSSKAEKKFDHILNSTIEETFGAYDRGHPNVIQDHLTKVTSDRLFNSIVENYLKVLATNGIKSGKFIYNLSFIPKENQVISFEDEMNKAKSVLYNSKTKLSDYLIKEPSLIENVVSKVPIPTNGQRFQYIGGNIHASLDIDSIKFKEDENKSEYKGKILLRKYYRFNYPADFNYVLNQEKLKIGSSAMVKTNESNSIISTIDTFCSFDEKEEMIKPKKVKIYLGTVEPVEYEGKKFLSRIFGESKKSGIETGKLQLYGVYIFKNSEIELEISPKSLVYDIEKKQFDPIASEIDINIKTTLVSSSNRAKITKEVLDIMLLKKPEYLIKELNIGRVHNQLYKLETQL